MSNPLHATRVYPRVNSWPRSSNAGLENVCQRATSITTLQTIPLPFFTDIFLGIFCSQKFSHFNFLCVCVRYSFKSRPFNCDPFSCPGPQRDAPPVLGKELTGNFVVQCTRVGGSASLLALARRWTRPATLFCSAVCWGLQETQAELCRVVCRHWAAGGGKNVTALITKKYPAFYLGEKQWIYETCKIVQRNSSVEWEEMRVACDKFDSQRNNWGSFLVILNCFRKRSQRISAVDPETNFASSENI